MKKIVKFEDFCKSINEDIDPIQTQNSENDSEVDFSENLGEQEEEEEESGEYIGAKLMKELSDKLGTPIVNNEINYNGMKINYFSETEKFHIGRDKFKTIDEVVDFLDKKTEPVKESLRYKSKRKFRK